MKSLHLHIGPRKTGSTAIQYAGRDLHKELLECTDRVLFPISLMHGQQRHHSHGDLARSMTNKGARPAKGDPWKRLHQESKGKEYKNLVLSTELFSRKNPKQLAELIHSCIPDFDCLNIYYYARPIHEWIISNYSQKVRVRGITHEFSEECVRYANSQKEKNSIQALNKRWTRHFGKGLIFRPVIGKELFLNSVATDFYRHIISDSAIIDRISAMPKGNPSLQWTDIQSIRATTSILKHDFQLSFHASQRYRVMRIVESCAVSVAQDGTGKFRWPRDLAMLIRKAQFDQAKWLDQIVFGKPLFVPRMDEIIEQSVAGDKEKSLFELTGRSETQFAKETRQAALKARTKLLATRLPDVSID